MPNNSDGFIIELIGLKHNVSERGFKVNNRCVMCNHYIFFNTMRCLSFPVMFDFFLRFCCVVFLNILYITVRLAARTPYMWLPKKVHFLYTNCKIDKITPQLIHLLYNV